MVPLAMSNRKTKLTAMFESQFSNFDPYGPVTRHFRTPQRRFKYMNILERAAGFSTPQRGARILISLLGLALIFAIWPQNVSAHQDAPAPPQTAPPPTEQAPPYTQGTPEQ